MTTRANLRIAIREELADPGPAYVWTDGLLNGFINEAIGQLSIDLAPREELTLAAVVGQRDYIITTATLLIGPGGIKSVQFPAGYRLEAGDTDRQYEGSSSDRPFPQCWEFIRTPGGGQTLRFRYPLAQAATILIRAQGSYTQPATDSDNLDVTLYDEVLLKWLACYRAYAWLDETRGKRSGVSVAGNRGSQGYYLRLYNSALTARQRAARVHSAVLAY
jgi:hypothetical protein